MIMCVYQKANLCYVDNPKLFKITFSGTSKRRRKEETTGKNVKKAQHELDHNGLVPLPVKVCFTCNRYLFFQGSCSV